MVQKVEPKVSSEDIRHMCGDIPDWKMAAIAALMPEPGDVAIAVAWADQLDEAGEERPLEGAAAQIFDILVAGEEEEDRR